MVNRQPQWTTDSSSSGLLDEEDERERVLLVGVGAAVGDRSGGATELETSGDPAIATYALSVELVREVIRHRVSTRVPGAPAALRGLVNVRGMVVTVLDLATCLGLGPGPGPAPAPAPASASVGAGSVTEPRAQTAGSIVLLEHGGRLVGLAVDRVREVRALDDVGLVGPPASGVIAGFVRGMASAGGEVVTVLDAAALIARHLISGES